MKIKSLIATVGVASILALPAVAMASPCDGSILLIQNDTGLSYPINTNIVVTEGQIVDSTSTKATLNNGESITYKMNSAEGSGGRISVVVTTEEATSSKGSGVAQVKYLTNLTRTSCTPQVDHTNGTMSEAGMNANAVSPNWGNSSADVVTIKLVRK